MNSRLIQDWCDYCEGKSDFNADHFNTLFMSELDRRELQIIFSYFPNAPALVSNVAELWSDELWNADLRIPESKRCDKIRELTISDLKEKEPVIQKEAESTLLKCLENPVYRFVDWEVFADVFRQDETVGLFIDTVGEHVLYELLPRDRNVLTLYEALYGLGGSLELRWSLISPLFIGGEYRFRSFFDLWLIGGRYAVTEDAILFSALSANRE
jgi:hypothetical protein